MPTARPHALAHYALELDGNRAGTLYAATGGEAYADVVEETVGPDLVVRKHIAGLRYSDIEIECGSGMGNDIYAWISDMLARKASRKSGAIAQLDYSWAERQRLAFSNALITEVGFPALDGTSRDPARIAVRIAPELTQRASGSGAKTGAYGPEKKQQWLRSNFRLTIDGLECRRASRVESLVVRQAAVEDSVGEFRDYEQQPSALEIGDLVVTLPESDASDWYAWHNDFVVRGNAGPAFEKSGKLQLLAADRQKVLFELSFKGLGIYRLAAEQPEESTHEGIPRVRASMYCEELTFVLGAPTSVSSATPGATSGNGASPPPSEAESAGLAPPSRVEAVAALAQLEPEVLLPARAGASRIRPI